jgi:Holliday junction resolvasome RuvABC endonuclease subunit
VLNAGLNIAMLSVPADPCETVTLIATDPGSESLGCACFTLDIRTLSIVNIWARTYHGSKLYPNTYTAFLHGERLAKIEAHEALLLKVLQDERPVCLVCESPFINMKRPQAYGALMEVISAIRSAMRQYDFQRPMYMVDPPSAKKAVGAPGNADKLTVQQHILANQEIMRALSSPLHSLDEHSFDAIAIGYHQVLQYRKTI